MQLIITVALSATGGFALGLFAMLITMLATADILRATHVHILSSCVGCAAGIIAAVAIYVYGPY